MQEVNKIRDKNPRTMASLFIKRTKLGNKIQKPMICWYIKWNFLKIKSNDYANLCIKWTKSSIKFKHLYQDDAKSEQNYNGKRYQVDPQTEKIRARKPKDLSKLIHKVNQN
jgi:hypothetical protein